MATNAVDSLLELKSLANKLGITDIANFVLNDDRFPIWSGSGKPYQHHYGTNGLVIHTNEVVRLCLSNNQLLEAGIDERKLYLAALFHDSGKMWDYHRDVNNTWCGTSHKRHIHHISRSALNWQEAIFSYWNPNQTHSDSVPYEWLTDVVVDEILHAILSHHGLREWGSPVLPNTKLAWMLHLCDGISARINDAEKWDHLNDKARS